MVRQRHLKNNKAPRKATFEALWKCISCWKYDEAAEVCLSHAKYSNEVGDYARVLRYLLLANSVGQMDKNEVKRKIDEIDERVLDKLRVHLKERLNELRSKHYLRELEEETKEMLRLIDG